MIKFTDQYFWNIVFLAFFSGLVVMGSIILETETRIPFAKLTLIDYTLITLATWRVTRLFINDAITKFFREQFYDVKKVGKGFQLEKPKFGPRRTIADLISCPWCFSVWAGAMVIFFYLITPYAIYPVIFLAVSSLASFLQVLSSAIGYKAEILKKESGE
jgi:small-conductance mechanosensitive channel